MPIGAGDMVQSTGVSGDTSSSCRHIKEFYKKINITTCTVIEYLQSLHSRQVKQIF